jgi:hypothetical protein
MSSLRTLATAKLPVEIGSVEVAADGSVTRTAVAKPLRFGFEAFGATFAGEVGVARRLTVTTDLGAMPYTIEGRDRRIDLAHIVAEARQSLVGGTITITPQQRVVLTLTDDLEAPLTPAEIITSASMLALRAQPWITLTAQTASQAGKRG